MESAQTDKHLDMITRLVSDLFIVDATLTHDSEVVLALRRRYSDRRPLQLVQDRLKLAGYEYQLTESDDTISLRVSRRRRLRIPTLNIVLFVATLMSVYLVPVFIANLAMYNTIRNVLAGTVADLRAGAGIEFTVAVMSILLVHEMGHFIASRRRGVITSWPYFIPAPNIIGSFGAVIKSKSPFWNRRDLLEVGAAGPVAGWIVAVAWLIYGLSHSTVAMAVQSPKVLAFTMTGESILVRVLAPLIAGPAPHGYFYIFSEAAFAGWVGVLITAINMLPIGQLDGGHVIYGLVGRFQQRLGWLSVLLLLVLGIQSMMWWFFVLLGFIFGVKHPPTLNDSLPPARPAVIMGIAALVILVLSFTPVPFPFPFPPLSNP